LTDLKKCQVYLVGSIAVPSNTVEEAMEVAAGELGNCLSALPDGEVGVRGSWVGGLGFMTWSRHPQIRSEVDGPVTVSETGSPSISELGSYRLAAGVTDLSLEGYSPYADCALSSYAVFRRLKEERKIDDDVRFQVALPTPYAAVVPFFGDPTQWPVVMSAWQRTMVDDISKILEVVPAEELSLQWDYCAEVCDVVGEATGGCELDRVFPWNRTGTLQEKFDRHTAQDYVRGFAEGVPDEVRFGLHFCLGTFPTVPTTPTRDLSQVVRLANAVVARSPRRVDFVHLPGTAEADREFFAPLADLEVPGARVFLGIGHHDGSDKIASRADVAREFLSDFGLSHYCGYGRDDRDHMRELLRDLRGAAELMGASQ